MRWFFAVVLAMSLLGLTRAHAEDDMETCVKRRAELLKQAAAYAGDPRTKRLIEADLKRAYREQAEGDGDECLEALDHAAKLLAGQE
jgi:hypothetical protein